jgi:hypothetical protein
LDSLPASLNSKLKRIHEYCLAQVQPPDIDFGDVTVQGTVTPWYYQLNRRIQPTRLNVAYRVNDSVSERIIPISEATQRLIDNIWPSIEQMAWDHLRTRLGAPSRPSTPKRMVYLGYRRSADQARRSFVRTTADKLGKEGFYPWWDEWQIKAGDSLPREMADGLENAHAIIIVLTPDFPDGRWAREELETAITLRVERNIKVIPVLFEHFERPTLLQSLRYVDATAHEPEDYERQFLEIIDALNEVDLNPYRR